MVNILLERYLIDSDWLFDELKEYIHPDYKVLVVAFSFRDNRVHSLSDWENLYGKEQGKLYRGIVDSFLSYGVKEENIDFLNYFSDSKVSAKKKVESADILYFLGGLPDRMYERLIEFDLLESISAHKGVAIGYSAGAAIQLEEYYLSPDDDYAEFAYYKGIPYLNDFYIEVHYENTKIQNECISRVLREKKKKVYAIHHDIGGIVVNNGNIKLLGKVDTFYP